MHSEADTIELKYFRKARDRQIGRCLPDLFDYHTLLYVGCKLRWNYPSFRCQDGFDSAGYKIDILEILPKNIMRLNTANEKGYRFLNGYRGPGMFRNIIKGDVRDAKELGAESYDVVMWWQGPEHLPLEDIPTTLDDLFSMTNRLLVIGCPCSGVTERHPMADLEQNKPRPGERAVGISSHLSMFSREYFEDLDFNVDVVGICGEKGNNLLAWKRRQDDL